MTTLEILDQHYERIIGKIKEGIPLTKEDRAVMKIWQARNAGKSPLSGKRAYRNSSGGMSYK